MPRRPDLLGRRLPLTKRLRNRGAALALAAFAWPHTAVADTDFTLAARVECVVASVTRCGAAGRCATRAATALDRTDVLTFDFGARTAAMRRGGETRRAEVVADRVIDGVRRIAINPAGRADHALTMTLTRAGALSVDYGGGTTIALTCAAAS